MICDTEVLCAPTPVFFAYYMLKTSYYVFHDRVTLFFADNFSTECRITIEILHNFF